MLRVPLPACMHARSCMRVHAAMSDCASEWTYLRRARSACGSTAAAAASAAAPHAIVPLVTTQPRADTLHIRQSESESEHALHPARCRCSIRCVLCDCVPCVRQVMSLRLATVHRLTPASTHPFSPHTAFPSPLVLAL